MTRVPFFGLVFSIPFGLVRSRIKEGGDGGGAGKLCGGGEFRDGEEADDRVVGGGTRGHLHAHALGVRDHRGKIGWVAGAHLHSDAAALDLDLPRLCRGGKGAVLVLLINSTQDRRDVIRQRIRRCARGRRRAG